MNVRLNRDNLRTHGNKAGAMATAFAILAMEQGLLVGFDHGGKPRIGEVHAIGTSPKDGSLVMRVYQTGGESSRPLPVWTLFRMDMVEFMEILDGKSAAPREGYVQGDASMSTIIAELEL